MALNNTNMILSLAMLGNANIPQDKKLAAAVGASMMPGMLGLVFPLLVARGAGTTTSPPAGTTLQTKVPNVAGQSESAAVETIKKAGLVPVVSRVYFKPVDGTTAPPVGQVAAQDPKPSADWVAEGSTVKLEVSLGSPPAQASESDEELALEKEISSKVSDMGAKVDLILARVGNATEKPQAKH
jgi:beta-lactam-binding protein with PASTA domain